MPTRIGCSSNEDIGRRQVTFVPENKISLGIEFCYLLGDIFQMCFRSIGIKVLVIPSIAFLVNKAYLLKAQ